MYRCFLKRVFDVVLSVLGIPFVVLLTIILGPLIFFTDKGPIFYCSKRIGRNGVIFTMIKFRSMKVNSPDIRTETDDCYNSEDDPRVTWIGKILPTPNKFKMLSTTTGTQINAGTYRLAIDAQDIEFKNLEIQ